MRNGLGKIKQLKQIAVLGIKQVPEPVQKPQERSNAWTGWAQTRQRSVPIFLLYLPYE